MSWEKVQIRKICNVISGYAFKSTDFTTSGIPIIKIKNIRHYCVDLIDAECVSDKFLNINPKYYVNDNDILISLTGSHITLPNSVVGRVAKYRYQNIALLNQRAGKFIEIDENVCNPEFLYQYLTLDSVRHEIANKAQGAANQANISPDDVKEIEISLPPLHTQQKIAGILSAYDDLIENNLKRIKLLEEAARIQYKELIQDTIISTYARNEYIKDCLEYYIGGGWGAEEYKEGFSEAAYVIRGTDIPDVRGGNILGVPLRYHKESNLSSRKLRPGDIVFEVSGGSKDQPVGRSILIAEETLNKINYPIMCASFCKLLRPNRKVTPEFMYLYLRDSYENGVLSQYEKHSASNIVNYGFEEFIAEQQINIPFDKELMGFTDKVKPLFSLISILGEQNNRLREARDILLPRLMSGEIEV